MARKTRFIRADLARLGLRGFLNRRHRDYFAEVRARRRAATRLRSLRVEPEGTRRARERAARRLEEFLSLSGQHAEIARRRVERFQPHLRRGNRARGGLARGAARSLLGLALREASKRQRATTRKALQLLGREAVKHYKRRLRIEIGLTTVKRTGRLRTRISVRRRIRNGQVAIRENFPNTAFKSGARSGQYAYVVSSAGGANRGFIRLARADTNKRFDKFYARARARVISKGG